MSKNQCPYCSGEVTYWQKLKPVVTFRHQFITCASCEKKISDFWIKGAVGLALGAGGAGLLAGRSEYGVQSIVAVGFAFLVPILLAPLFIELRECNEVDAEKIREERLEKEMEFSWRRALILAAGCIGFMAIAIWVMQPSKI